MELTPIPVSVDTLKTFAKLHRTAQAKLTKEDAALDSLPEVVAAVHGQVPVIVDSGFRRGSDIVKALALGADFVLMGRPFAWAVAAEGEAGVAHLITLLEREIQITLNLMGLSSIDALRGEGRSVLSDTLTSVEPGHS